MELGYGWNIQHKIEQLLDCLTCDLPSCLQSRRWKCPTFEGTLPQKSIASISGVPKKGSTPKPKKKLPNVLCLCESSKGYSTFLLNISLLWLHTSCMYLLLYFPPHLLPGGYHLALEEKRRINTWQTKVPQRRQQPNLHSIVPFSPFRMGKELP